MMKDLGDDVADVFAGTEIIIMVYDPDPYMMGQGDYELMIWPM